MKLNEALELKTIVDKALNLPTKGQHIGNGPHVPMPETWDGIGETPLGWTKTSFDVTEETAQDFKVDEKLLQEVQKPERQAKLSAQEVIKLESLTAAEAVAAEPTAEPAAIEEKV